MLWSCKTAPHAAVLPHVMEKVRFMPAGQIKAMRYLLSAMQDVYTDSGLGLTSGNAFPASEVTKVSQDSRHLWLQQRPFRLKRSMSTSLALLGEVHLIMHIALMSGLPCCSCYPQKTCRCCAELLLGQLMRALAAQQVNTMLSKQPALKKLSDSGLTMFLLCL